MSRATVIYTALGVPDIHFFADILIRDRVVLEIYGDVVVQLDRSGFPLGELVWIAGKRLQKREFFFQKYGAPATILLLERGVIEPVQFLADCSIHCMDVKKFPVPQAGNDVGSQVPNAPLDRGFVARSQYPGGEQCCVIVIRQLLVGTVDDGI